MCINSITRLELPGTRECGRPRKTWSACVRNDMTICNVDGVNPLDRNSWRTSVRRCQVLPTQSPGQLQHLKYQNRIWWWWWYAEMQKPPSAAICILNLTSCAGGDTINRRPCKLTISSYLFTRWHQFRHVGYLRHQQQFGLWPFDHESGVRVTCDVGYLCANFSLPGPLCSRVRCPMYATDRQTDRRQMSDVRQKHRLMRPPYGGGITTAQNVPQADQPRAFDDDDLFSFIARNDVPQEQDLLLLNLIYISLIHQLQKQQTMLFWAANKEKYLRLYRLHLKHYYPSDLCCCGALLPCKSIWQLMKCWKECLSQSAIRNFYKNLNSYWTDRQIGTLQTHYLLCM